MAASTSISSSAFSVDTTGIKDLAKALRVLEPEVAKGFRKQLRTVGELIAEEAKERSRFSTRIPGSIRVRQSGVSIKVVAGGDAAPDAAPFENKGKQGSFRHPVFGNYDVWVEQRARPFLAPSIEAKQEEVVELVAGAVDVALDAAGWR